MPAWRVHAAAVAVSELATNAIKYGGGILRIWTDNGQLVCEVSDDGHLDDPLAGQRPVPPTQLSGRGLLLVNLMTDLVRTRRTPHGTTMRFHMAIAGPAREAPTGDWWE